MPLRYRHAAIALGNPHKVKHFRLECTCSDKPRLPISRSQVLLLNHTGVYAEGGLGGYAEGGLGGLCGGGFRGVMQRGV